MRDNILHCGNVQYLKVQKTGSKQLLFLNPTSEKTQGLYIHLQQGMMIIVAN